MVLDAKGTYVSDCFELHGDGTPTEEPGHEVKVAPLRQYGEPGRVTFPSNQGNVGSN